MTFDEVDVGCKYECQMTKTKVTPIYIVDRVPKSGFVCKNLDSGREIYIKAEDVPKKIKSRIDNMNEWRLKNGD